MLLCILAFSLLLSGCSQAVEKAVEEKAERDIEKATGKEVEIDTEKNKVEVETEEGKAEIQTGEEASLPEDFPSDFPIYKEARATASFSTETEGGKGYQVMLSTTDDFNKVVDYYKSELEKAGYKIVSTISQTGKSQAFYFENKKTGASGTVQVEAGLDGEPTSIVIIIGKQ
jgi:hypothetical protein